LKRAALILLVVLVGGTLVHCDKCVTCSEGRGCVIIDPEPDELAAPWLLVGPKGFYSPSSGDSMFCDLAPGDYTLTWRDTEYWNAPDPDTETQRLGVGGEITFTFNYAPDAGTLVIETEPDSLDVEWSLHCWSAGVHIIGSGDTTLTPMPPGLYEIEWIDIWGFDSPLDESVYLHSGETLTITGQFTIDVPNYYPYDSPDNLIANFTEAWNHMAFAEYRDNILYDGVELATDGMAYEAFKFYFIIPDDVYGPFWEHEAEIEHTEGLFSGDDALDGSPGVKVIQLRFTPLTFWNIPDNPFEVAGDGYPEGTLHHRYATDLSIELKGVNHDGFSGYEVDDHVEFYAIPVGDPEHPEYRLWKWFDIGNGFLLTQQASWSAIKALY